MKPQLYEFLQSKGGIGLLEALETRGRRYSEIEERVLISSSTINTRKDEALEIGLIEMKPVKQERTYTEYHLTDVGHQVVHELSERGVLTNYRDMRQNKREMEEGIEQYISQIQDEPAKFLGSAAYEEETLIRRESGEEPTERPPYSEIEWEIQREMPERGNEDEVSEGEEQAKTDDDADSTESQQKPESERQEDVMSYIDEDDRNE